MLQEENADVRVMTPGEVAAEEAAKVVRGPACPDSATTAMFDYLNEQGQKFVGLEGSRNTAEKNAAWASLGGVVTAAALRAGIEHTWDVKATKGLYDNKKRSFRTLFDKAAAHVSGAENYWAKNKKPVWYDAASAHFGMRAATAPKFVVEVGAKGVKVEGNKERKRNAPKELSKAPEEEEEEEEYDEDPGGPRWSTHVMHGTGTGGGVPQSLPTSPEPAPREERRKSKAAARAKNAAAADAGVAAKKAAAGAAAAAADEATHQRNATYAAKANAEAFSAVLAPFLSSFTSVLEKSLAALAAPPPPPPPPQ
jgi:hypothetical protein